MNVSTNHAIFTDSEEWNKMSPLDKMGYSRVPDNLTDEVSAKIGDRQSAVIQPEPGSNLANWAARKRKAKAKAKRKLQASSRKKNR